MRPTKFNFISPENELTPSNSNIVSISRIGIITFFAEYIQSCQLEGKFIRFFVDPDKNELGWVLAPKLGDFKDIKCSSYRPLKLNPNKLISLSIKKILARLGVTIDSKPVRLEVEEYCDKMLGTIHHVQLPSKKYNLRKLAKDKDGGLDEIAEVLTEGNNE
jgi:hypothetical protein